MASEAEPASTPGPSDRPEAADTDADVNAAANSNAAPGSNPSQPTPPQEQEQEQEQDQNAPSRDDDDDEAANDQNDTKDSEAQRARSPSSPESGEASSPEPDAPPLPNEAPPPPEDDGWDFQWDPSSQAYFFYNRFTGATTWENPRMPSQAAAATSAQAAPGSTPADTSGAPGSAPDSAPPPPLPTGGAPPGVDPLASASPASAPPPLPAESHPAAGGYNPAIHGDYDPNAWYAKGPGGDGDGDGAASGDASLQQQYNMMGEYNSTATFNRFTGQFQGDEWDPDRHTDEAKSRRQMNNFFDVDAAANSHDGRSLKAERSGKKPSKAELKHFKEKRKARKEEKRRAWLRD